MHYRIKRYIFCVIALAVTFSNIAFAQTPNRITHWDFQACDSDGAGTYPPLITLDDKVTLEGVILNNPEQMLPSWAGAPTPRKGQWQMFIQPDDTQDHAGTCIWLGQDYNRVGTGAYSNEQYQSEIYRIDHDPNTVHLFRIGDKVKVTGCYKFYKGKMNVNEYHQVNPDFDFNIELLEARVGLPQPEVVSLDELKDDNDNFIFDQTRNSGCEYYQSRLVRINNVTVIDPQNWGKNKIITVSNGNGLTFPVILGHGYGISEYQCPTGNIDVIGIMDQETATFSSYKDGYRIYLCNYDGNGKILTDFGQFKNHIDGDIDLDGDVDLADFSRLAENWLTNR